jgi:hypothetical protein
MASGTTACGIRQSGHLEARFPTCIFAPKAPGKKGPSSRAYPEYTLAAWMDTREEILAQVRTLGACECGGQKVVLLRMDR